MNLIRDFSDDNLPDAAPQIFDFPTTAQPKAALAGTVGVGDIFRRLDNDPAGGKIRAWHELQQRIVARIRCFDQMDAGIYQFRDIVRRDVGCHAHGNTRRPICQQIGKLGRQDHRFGKGAIVIFTKIDRVLVQSFQHRFGYGGHPRLSIAACGWVITVDIAKITLTVDQWIAHVKILRQTRHGVVNRGITVRVIVPHHIAGNFCRLPETSGGIEPQFAHRIKDSPVYGL